MRTTQVSQDDEAENKTFVQTKKNLKSLILAKFGCKNATVTPEVLRRQG